MARTREEIINRSWLTEPRKSKRHSEFKLGVKDYYKKYKELYWDNRSNHITAGTFYSILREVHREIVKAIIEEAFEFEMPHTTGLIYVGTIKAPPLKTTKSGILNRPIDKKATLDLWANSEEAFEKKQKVYITNLHSNGKTAKINYLTYKYAYFRGKQSLAFLPCRQFKRDLVHVMKHKSDYPDANYVEIERWNTQN